MKTTSFRLDEKELERIEKVAEEKGGGKSQSVRDLLDYGWEYLKIRQYRKGDISLSRLSQELDKPINEVINLLADLGVQSPLEKADVLEGYEALADKY